MVNACMFAGMVVGMYAGLEYGMGKARGGKRDWVRDCFLLGVMHFYWRCDPQHLNLNQPQGCVLVFCRRMPQLEVR